MSSISVDSKSIKELPDQIVFNTSEIQEKFNLASFMFSHNLAGHPLFELPRLVELANTLSKDQPNKIACQASEIPAHSKWSEIPTKEYVEEVISKIEDSGSWVLLYSVQQDPEYNFLLNKIITELEALTGRPLQKEITWLDAYIFIASPHSVTPYHIDHESTFLFQIHGEREANIFDSFDRSVLTDEEIERYYIGDLQSANYLKENQSKASVYKLAPGKGVHHPVRAPHWFKNGDKYSIAMGIHFCQRSYDLQARIYQFNYYLRRLGLTPIPPGKSAIRDKAKIFAMGLLAKRNPSSKYELIRSSITRLQKLTQVLHKGSNRIQKIIK
jgi:hypothetical protein